LGHWSALRGLLNSLVCREPDADNLNETLGVAIDLTILLLLHTTEGNMAQTGRRSDVETDLVTYCSAGFRAQTGCAHSVAGPRSTEVPWQLDRRQLGLSRRPDSKETALLPFYVDFPEINFKGEKTR
jgi:hypothetical protein